MVRAAATIYSINQFISWWCTFYNERTISQQPNKFVWLDKTSSTNMPNQLNLHLIFEETICHSERFFKCDTAQFLCLLFKHELCCGIIQIMGRECMHFYVTKFKTNRFQFSKQAIGTSVDLYMLPGRLLRWASAAWLAVDWLTNSL